MNSSNTNQRPGRRITKPKVNKPGSNNDNNNNERDDDIKFEDVNDNDSSRWTKPTVRPGLPKSTGGRDGVPNVQHNVPKPPQKPKPQGGAAQGGQEKNTDVDDDEMVVEDADDLDSTPWTKPTNRPKKFTGEKDDGGNGAEPDDGRARVQNPPPKPPARPRVRGDQASDNQDDAELDEEFEKSGVRRPKKGTKGINDNDAASGQDNASNEAVEREEIQSVLKNEDDADAIFADLEDEMKVVNAALRSNDKELQAGRRGGVLVADRAIREKIAESVMASFNADKLEIGPLKGVKVTLAATLAAVGGIALLAVTAPTGLLYVIVQGTRSFMYEGVGKEFKPPGVVDSTKQVVDLNVKYWSAAMKMGQKALNPEELPELRKQELEGLKAMQQAKLIPPGNLTSDHLNMLRRFNLLAAKELKKDKKEKR